MTMMNKEDLLRSIAETGYNVGFGAKKNFATYDMIEKLPGLIGFISTAFGIYALIFDALSGKFLAATLTIIGLCSLYISQYDKEKSKYEKAGVKLTSIYNGLRDLYRVVKNSDVNDTSAFYDKLKTYEEDYLAANISKQMLLSDWYTHYKFFWQHQIDWVDEQKKFRFWRDKVPLSFMVTVVIVVFSFLVWLALRATS